MKPFRRFSAVALFLAALSFAPKFLAHAQTTTPAPKVRSDSSITQLKCRLAAAINKIRIAGFASAALSRSKRSKAAFSSMTGAVAVGGTAGPSVLAAMSAS